MSRLSININPRPALDLATLMLSTDLSKTAVVCRALALYRLVDERQQAGQKLAFYDVEADRYESVEIL